MGKMKNIGMSLMEQNLKNSPNKDRSTPKKFTKDYIQSPKYKERLESSGYDADAEIKERASNVESVRSYGQYGKPSLDKQVKFKAEGRPYTETGGSSYLPKEKAIVVDHKQAKEYNIEPESIEAHEFGHAETGTSTKENEETGVRESRLNDADNEQIISRLKDDANEVYKKAPDEIKSDLNALRFELQDKQLYDAGTEDFDKSILEKLDDSYIKTRLLKSYSEEDIEWMMNNIAMNEDENSTELIS